MPTEPQQRTEGGLHLDFVARMLSARRGDQDAWHSLVHEFSPRLRAIIRAHFWQLRTLRGRLTAADLLQETWMTVAASHFRDEAFYNQDHFLRFLIRIAKFKLKQTLRDHTQIQKRSLGREVPISATCLGREPAPDQVAQANDAWAHWVGGLSMEQQRVMTMRKDGYTYEEIAKVLGITDRTVARLMQAIRDLIRSGKALIPSPPLQLLERKRSPSRRCATNLWGEKTSWRSDRLSRIRAAFWR